MPLTEDEKRRLLELIDRGEDLTPEEADELLNLAKKFYNEYAGKVQDAWKMLYYAAANTRNSAWEVREEGNTTKTQTPNPTLNPPSKSPY